MKALWLVAVVLAGCVKSSEVACGDGHVCAPDKVCDAAHEACVFPDQLLCKDMVDGTACTIDGAPGGICNDGVCLSPTCGDEIRTGDEVCDGATDIPAVGTCVDFAFDYGALSCNALCTEGLESCHRLGWQLRSTNGFGGIAGIWEDGADVWFANQQGVFRRHAGVFEPLIQPSGATVWYFAIWAGGGHAFAAGNNGAVAHFNGTSWSTDTLTTASLHGIWGRSPTDVYAVGGKVGGEVYHFDGTSWSPMSLPATAPPLAGIHGVGNDVYAVGSGGAVLHLTGTTWTRMTSNTTHDLVSVWAIAPNNVFVVGNLLNTDAVSMRYNGSTWDALALPLATHQLTSISGRSATEVYAVGARDGSNILFFDGVGWTPMDSPVSTTILSLNAVHAGTAAVYAARRPGLILEYQNAGRLDTTSVQIDVRGLWGIGADYVVAVGDGFFYQVWEKNRWTTRNYPTCWGMSSFVNAVWGSSVDDFWIVGPYGNLMHKIPTKSDPDCFLAPNFKWMWDVWGFAPNDIYAVGADQMNQEANLLHYNGTTWTDQSDRVMPLATILKGVWGSAPNDLYAVGGNVVLHYNGTAWSNAGLVTTHTLRAVWGSSATDVFVVGGEGAIYHFDGSAWTQVVVPHGITVPTDEEWTDVHGTGANDVFVVGSRTLLHYDGTSWSPISRVVAGSAEAVWAAPNAVVVSGELGIDPRLIGRLQ